MTLIKTNNLPSSQILKLLRFRHNKLNLQNTFQTIRSLLLRHPPSQYQFHNPIPHNYFLLHNLFLLPLIICNITLSLFHLTPRITRTLIPHCSKLFHMTSPNIFSTTNNKTSTSNSSTRSKKRHSINKNPQIPDSWTKLLPSVGKLTFFRPRPLLPHRPTAPRGTRVGIRRVPVNSGCQMEIRTYRSQ